MVGLGGLLLVAYLAAPGEGLFNALRLIFTAVLIKLLCFDLPSWDLSLGRISYGDSVWTLRYGGGYSFQLALMRLLDFAAIIGIFVIRVPPPDSGRRAGRHYPAMAGRRGAVPCYSCFSVWKSIRYCINMFRAFAPAGCRFYGRCLH